MVKAGFNCSIVLLIVLIVCPTRITYAQSTFYIRDSVVGSVTRPPSCSDCSNCNICSSWSNSCDALPETLCRGATYYIASGTYGSESFDEPGADLITLMKATVQAHGTATGWQDDFANGTAKWTGWGFQGSNYNVNGVTGGGPGNWNSGLGFEVENVGTIDQCPYQPDAACTSKPRNGTLPVLVSFGAGASNITIQHVNIHGTNKIYPLQAAVKGTGGNSNLTFSNNWIHTIFGVMFHIGSWQDVTIEKSLLADLRVTATSDPLGICGCWHGEGISSIGTNTNIIIRNNIWDSIVGTAVIAGVNTGISNGWKIFGNVFSRSTAPLWYVSGEGTNNQVINNLQFFNNTMVDTIGSQGGVVIGAGTGNLSYNNIWYRSNVNMLALSGAHGYNYFSDNVRTEGCAPPCDRDAQGAAGGTQSTVGSGSPFVSGAGPDPALINYRLSTSMPGVNVCTLPGVACSTTVGFDIDAYGKGRSNWDRGAYEYGAVGTDPLPSAPRNLQIN